MEEKIYDVAVVGGGIAGYTAALALKNFRRDCLWIGSKPFGEKLAAAETVRNYPAYSGNGAGLVSLLNKQMQAENIPFTQGRVQGVYAMPNGFMLMQGEKTYSARSVILATGVESAGSVKNEEKFLGRGVSYCAVCDGALYRGKNISVVISGKEFEHEVEYLAGFANQVTAFCLYKNPAFQAENIVIGKGIPFAVEGGERVEKLLLKGEEVPVDGVFFLKNTAPPSSLVGGLQTDGARVVTQRDCSTNLKGLFAAGDVTGRPYQYIKAAGEGLTAAYSANEYFLSLKKD